MATDGTEEANMQVIFSGKRDYCSKEIFVLVLTRNGSNGNFSHDEVSIGGVHHLTQEERLVSRLSRCLFHSRAPATDWLCIHILFLLRTCMQEGQAGS